MRSKEEITIENNMTYSDMVQNSLILETLLDIRELLEERGTYEKTEKKAGS